SASCSCLFFFFMIPRLPISSLFPYTTLFRSSKLYLHFNMFPEWHIPAVLCCHFSQGVKKSKGPSIRAAAFFQMEFIIQETPDFIHDYLSGKSGFCRHSAFELPV